MLIDTSHNIYFRVGVKSSPACLDFRHDHRWRDELLGVARRTQLGGVPACAIGTAVGLSPSHYKEVAVCEVGKSDQKCEHPWSQCMASRGEHCAVYGHDSSAPRRPSDTPPTPRPPAR